MSDEATAHAQKAPSTESRNEAGQAATSASERADWQRTAQTARGITMNGPLVLNIPGGLRVTVSRGNNEELRREDIERLRYYLALVEEGLEAQEGE